MKRSFFSCCSSRAAGYVFGVWLRSQCATNKTKKHTHFYTHSNTHQRSLTQLHIEKMNSQRTRRFFLFFYLRSKITWFFFLGEIPTFLNIHINYHTIIVQNEISKRSIFFCFVCRCCLATHSQRVRVKREPILKRTLKYLIKNTYILYIHCMLAHSIIMLMCTVVFV